MQENKKNQVRLLGMCPEQLSGYWFYLLESGKLEKADLGQDRNQQLCFDSVKFETFIRYPNGYAKWGVGYTNLELK